MNAELAEYLLQDPDHLQLGGAEHEASVMFVDIRGFTKMSEGRRPAAVLNEVNAFFAAIVPVIDDNRGLVLQYTGDGLLAVFGAPLPAEDHAQAAVDAAIGMVKVSREINKERVQKGQEKLRIGCSVHSGLVVCGNAGNAGRSQYTVMGDTANVAARLEEMNKLDELNREFPSEVVISEATFERLTRRPPTRGPFAFEIRGRMGGIRVYQVEIRDG